MVRTAFLALLVLIVLISYEARADQCASIKPPFAPAAQTVRNEVVLKMYEEIAEKMGVQQTAPRLCELHAPPRVMRAGQLLTILIPVDVLSYFSMTGLRAVLAHELAHVARGDVNRNPAYSDRSKYLAVEIGADIVAAKTVGKDTMITGHKEMLALTTPNMPEPQRKFTELEFEMRIQKLILLK